MNSLTIYTKIEALSKNLRQEVSDCIDFLIDKTSKQTKTTIAKFGSVKGTIQMSSDFDEPLEDFKTYM